MLQKNSTREENIRRAYKGGATVDEKTIIHLCQQYLHREYGNRGSVTLIARTCKNGKLLLTAENALWAQELWIQREHVQNYINRMCGSVVVNKIVARVE